MSTWQLGPAIGTVHRATSSAVSDGLKTIAVYGATGWQPIDSAPRDRAIWARENTRDYEAKMVWNGHEWECVDFRGKLMGIGFYPTHWQGISAPPSDTKETR